MTTDADVVVEEANAPEADPTALPPLVAPDKRGEERLEKYRDRAGYEIVTFAGKRWHFFFCGIGIRQAGREGLHPYRDMIRLVPTMALYSDKRTFSLAPWDEWMGLAADFFYAGVCLFNEAIQHEDILAEMDLRGVKDLQGLLLRQWSAAMDQMKETKTPKETADGSISDEEPEKKS